MVDTYLPYHHKTNTLAPKKKEITFWSSFPGNVNTTTLFPRSPANPINAPAALSCLSGAPHLFPYLGLSSVVVCRPGIEFDPWTSTLTNCPAPHSLCNCFYAKARLKFVHCLVCVKKLSLSKSCLSMKPWLDVNTLVHQTNTLQCF